MNVMVDVPWKDLFGDVELEGLTLEEVLEAIEDRGWQMMPENPQNKYFGRFYDLAEGRHTQIVRCEVRNQRFYGPGTFSDKCMECILSYTQEIDQTTYGIEMRWKGGDDLTRDS